jgi:tol-pal system protein YbgF
LGFGLAAAPLAAAQTVVDAPPPDPRMTALQDRVDALDAEVRQKTGEIERLQFQLKKAQDENALLRKTIDDMNAQAAAGGAEAGGQQADAAAASVAPATGDPATAYANAYKLVAQGDHDGAEQALRAFLAGFPNDPRAPDAHYYLGQTLLVRGAATEAAAEFVGIIKATPKAAKAPDAMVRLGVALNRMGNKAEACSTLNALPTQYPRASAATKASAAAQTKAIGCAK